MDAAQGTRQAEDRGACTVNSENGLQSQGPRSHPGVDSVRLTASVLTRRQHALLQCTQHTVGLGDQPYSSCLCAWHKCQEHRTASKQMLVKSTIQSEPDFYTFQGRCASSNTHRRTEHLGQGQNTWDRTVGKDSPYPQGADSPQWQEIMTNVTQSKAGSGHLA